MLLGGKLMRLRLFQGLVESHFRQMPPFRLEAQHSGVDHV